MNLLFKLLLLLLVFFVCGCEKGINVKKNTFHLGAEKRLLYFDLVDDDNPTGGLIVSSSDSTATRNILLPFLTREIYHNEEVLSSSSNFNEKTIIHYEATINNPNSAIISFLPIFNVQSKDTYVRYDKGLYFIKNGLERIFIYNFEYSLWLQKTYPNFKFDTVNFIAINLPEGARGLAVEEGKTSKPDPLIESSNCKYYKLNITKGEKKLLTSYLIPPNEAQSDLVLYMLSIVSIFVVPVCEYFLREFQNPHSKTIKWIRNLLFGLIIAVFILLAYLFFSSTIDPTKLPNIVLVASSLISIVITTYIKRKSPKKDA